MCESLESMDHIYFECEAPGEKEIWAEAKSLWARTKCDWPQLSVGAVIGCGLLEVRNKKGKIAQGASQLLRILVSEAEFLIWKLRNTRVIDEKSEDPSPQKVINRFRAAIERRFLLAIALTNHNRFRERALNKIVMRNTWSKVTVSPEGRAAPSNWWAGAELLVSIWPPRPRGRER